MPVRGGATISPRCPLPIGVNRSRTRADRLSLVVSSLRRSSGYSGVRLSKKILLRPRSGCSKLTASTLNQGKIAFAFLRGPYLPGDGIAGPEIELSDLRRRYVNIVGTRQIVIVGRPQKTETVGQGLQNAFAENETALFGLRLQNLEDEFLLSHSRRTLDIQFLGD